MKNLKLLSTDFDGTLVGHPSDGKCSRDFADVLRDHAASGGLWAINTGRDLHHALEGVKLFAAPVEPDFLLTNERHVYRPLEAGGWEAHGSWNEICELRHSELHEAGNQVFQEICAYVKSRGDANMIYEEHRPVGLVTVSEEVMQEVVERIESICVVQPDIHYQRNAIYLRFCHREYDKGSALAELCRLEGILKEEVCSAGDHYNDISMLNVARAGMTACPSNAIPEVKEAVRNAGGYVATRPYADGIADAVIYYKKTAPVSGRRSVSLS